MVLKVISILCQHLVISGINTVENAVVADFKKEYTCIPWNPSYLKQMAILSRVIPGLSLNTLLEPVAFEPTLPGIFNFLKSQIMFDGFPSYLPCKMIMQNPNIETPENPQIALENFRTIDEDWTKVTNTNYWKLISNVMGNIDIKSWTGNINIVTSGALGNAGNINILANNKHGALPGYHVGNVNIKANTPFRTFTDPRDLFLDTHLVGKIFGQFAWFSTPAGGKPMMPPAITVKPFDKVQMILNLLGVPFQFGFASEESNGGGCKYCINDALYQTAVDLKLFTFIDYKTLKDNLFGEACKPHRFNALNQSLMHKGELIGGSTSVVTRQSNGYGHAVDVFKLDQMYGDYTFGSVQIEGTGSYNMHVGKNAILEANTNNWKFGVSSCIDTGWIEPSQSLIPWWDMIFGESPFQLPTLNYVCEPILKTYDRHFYNTFDNCNFGDYSASYSGIEKTGIYKLGVLEMGIMGNDTKKYDISAPGLYLNNQIFDMKLSKNIDIQTKPFNVNYNNKLFGNIYNDYENSLSDIEQAIQDSHGSLGDRLGEDDLTAGGGIASDSIREHLADEKNNSNQNKPATDPTPGADIPSANFKNGFKLNLGEIGKGVCLSGETQYVKLRQQMPKTAAVTDLAIAVVGVLSKLIPGIGEGAYQAAKMIPNLPVPDTNEGEGKLDNGANLFSKQTYKVFNPTHVMVSGGLIPTVSSKPMLYSVNNFGLPDISSVADSMVSVGTIFDPVGTLFNAITENFPQMMNNVQLNTTNGMGLPKPIADGLKMDDLVCARLGLFPGGNFRFSNNMLDSEQDKKGQYYDITAKLPFSVDENFELTSEYYTLKTGVKGGLTVGLTAINGTTDVDILDKTVALGVGGVTSPSMRFSAAGKDIFNVPDGAGGVIGGSLSDAILDLIE